MKVCSVEGCGKKHYGLGLCAAHYQKLRKYGSPYFSIHKRFKPRPDGAKVCSTCEILKDGTEYHFRTDTKTLTGQCKTCKAAKVDVGRRNRLARLRREKSTPEQEKNRKAYGRAKYEELKMKPGKITSLLDRHYFNKIKNTFGLSKEEYLRLLYLQKGVCAICKHPERKKNNKRLSVDHNHATGKVRGLLCDGCNRGIGFLKDSVATLGAATEYVKRDGN